MVERIKGKLRSCSGESIAETLVALLISALALLMLAGAVTASTRVITRSNDVIGDYYKGNRNLEEHSSSVPGSPIVIKDFDTGSVIKQYITNVSYYVNEFGNNTVVAYVITS